MLKIIQAPESVLSQPAKPINNIDKSIHRLIKNMEEALLSARDPEGVGLAAPQVGKSVQLFLIKQTPRSPILVFINPVIEKFIGETSVKKKEKKPEDDKGTQLEGCLSLYGIWGVVKRHPEVILSYQDQTGQKHKRKFTGFIATIIQHECDHLYGILFPKRVLEQNQKLYRSKKNEKSETEFEEIEL
jgi:peptide deformylase